MMYITVKITWDKCEKCGYYKLEYYTTSKAVINQDISSDDFTELKHSCCHCCKGSEYCKPNG